MCPLTPPPPNQQIDGFPLEFLLKGHQTELRTLSQNCEQTLQKLRTNRIMNKRAFLKFCWVLQVRVASGVDTEFPYRICIVYRGLDCRDPVCRHRFRFPEARGPRQHPLLWHPDILDGPNRRSPIASVQRNRSTLASQERMLHANRTIRIAAQRTQGL